MADTRLAAIVSRAVWIAATLEYFTADEVSRLQTFARDLTRFLREADAEDVRRKRKSPARKGNKRKKTKRMYVRKTVVKGKPRMSKAWREAIARGLRARKRRLNAEALRKTRRLTIHHPAVGDEALETSEHRGIDHATREPEDRPHRD